MHEYKIIILIYSNFCVYVLLGCFVMHSKNVTGLKKQDAYFHYQTKSEKNSFSKFQKIHMMHACSDNIISVQNTLCFVDYKCYFG